MNPADLTQTTNFSYLWLIPFFPLVGATINGLLGSRILKTFGPSVTHGIAILAPALSFGVTMMAMVELFALDPANEKGSVIDSPLNRVE